MTLANTLRRDHINIALVHARLGAEPYWSKPKPLMVGGIEAEDAWWLEGPGGAHVIVSYDPDSEAGVEWVHASICYGNQPHRYPSYMDLKRLHYGVFGDGHAYQYFVPAAEHINITGNVLHLWGRLDGAAALPNFGSAGTI